MNNSSAQKIFQFSESESKEYGDTTFGNACLVARNIVKSNLGTHFIQINSKGWDHHQDIYEPGAGIYARTKELDSGLAKLISDLAATPSKTKGKTLLDETLIVAMGEFGRTAGPLTDRQGRDHYLQMSALFAGAGMKGNRAIGKTDATGANTIEYGWTRNILIRPEDVFSTIYSALGIDYTTIRRDDPFNRGFEYIPYAKDGVYAPIDILW